MSRSEWLRWLSETCEFFGRSIRGTDELSTRTTRVYVHTIQKTKLSELRGQQILQNWPWPGWPGTGKKPPLFAPTCVLNNWYIYIYIYWYDDSMRIMGCFFFAFPCAKVPLMKDRQSTVGGPCGVPIRAFDEIACACCLWIVRRGPPEQVTDRQQIETSEINFPSQRTSGRFLAARSNAILTACSQWFFWIVRISVIQTRGNMRSNPNQRKHAPSWTWHCHKSFLWITCTD